MKRKHIRLSKNITAEKYSISLAPDLTAQVFEGNETISLVIFKPTKSITLHSNELDLESVSFEPATKRKRESLFAKKITYNEEAETATFHFSKTLPAGKGRLHISFRGVLSDKLRGFYRSRYINESQEKFIATTQFEATDARRAFPCFDEPEHKAVFEVTLTIPNHHEAISNTLPVNTIEHSTGFKTVRFSPTPKMSTYLVAFITGEFEFLEDKTKAGILVRLFVTPGKKHQAKFALEVAVKCMEFYEKYFGIAYPLPTLDMIAIPDFSAGAMENWGAVTYRETALLVDPDNSSTAIKQYVAIVVAHELAHQWFGNLVTMKWWTHLWLNEGFATYMEYLAVDHLFPEWEMWTQFASHDFAEALQQDALKDTHPIEVEVHHPREIDEIFDSISYSKGACLIRMLAEFLGKDNFRKGLQHYLKKHAYKNAETEDLWKSFETVSKKSVTKMMHTWTRTAGFPVIQARRKGDQLTLSQQRFFENPTFKKRPSKPTVWPIPIRFRDDKQTIQTKLLDKTKTKIAVPKTIQALKLNINETGFFRVAYQEQDWANFAQELQHKKYSTLDKLGLVNNVWSLALSGHTNIATALNFSLSLKHETDYTLWLELLTHLEKARVLWAKDTHLSESLAKFTCSLVDPLVKSLGFDPDKQEPHTKKLLRALALKVAGNCGNKDVLNKSKALFSSAQSDPSKIPADFRGFVYLHTAKTGGQSEFTKLKTMYIASDLSEEKNRIGSAMAHFSKPALVQKALEFSLTKHVRTQDAVRFNLSAGLNAFGMEINWKFLQTHWQTYLKIYGHGDKSITRLVESLSMLSTPEQAKEVKDFFKKNPAPSAERTIKQVVEKIYTNSLWLKRDTKKLQDYFSQ